MTISSATSFCKIGEDIIQLFVGKIDSLIKKLIEQDLPPKIATLLESKVNEALNKVPLEFAAQPSVQDDILTTVLELIPPSAGFSIPELAQQLRRSRLGAFVNRDISLSITARSMDDGLSLLASSGAFAFNKTLPSWLNTSLLDLFWPGVYNRCESCPLSIDFAVLPAMAPTVTLHNESILLNFHDAVLGINAVNSTTNMYDTIFDVYMNLTVGVQDLYVNASDKRLFFRLELETFSLTLDRSSIGNLNPEKLGEFISKLLRDDLIPMFNADFKGIPVNFIKDGYGIDKVIFVAKEEDLTIGFDVVFP